MIKRLQSRSVSTLTHTGLVRRCHPQDVYKEVYRWSEHVQNADTLPSDRTASAGWAHSTPMLQTPAVNHGCTRSSCLSQPIPIVPSVPSYPIRLLHQCCDQHRAWNRVQRFDPCPSSLFCERSSFPCLGFVTVVVSHAETVLPFQLLRRLQGFGESVSWVRLGRFLDHDQLSLLFRLKPQKSCLNVLERTALLSLDDAAWCR